MYEDVELRLPGPTPVPPRVFRAMTQPMIGHRSGDFSALYRRLVPFAKELFGTSGEVFFLTGSGTSAMETAVANLVSPKDRVLLLTCGNFGDRFGQILSAYQADVDRLEAPWGQAIDPEAVIKKLRSAGPYKAVFVTHNETSTGVVNDLARIGAAVKEYGRGALLVADSVSGLGGLELRMDDWSVDVAVTGSQKALMLPPGLALIGVSERAWRAIENNSSPRYYFNLLKYKASAAKAQTPYTPNIAHLFGLAEAFQMLQEEGLENVYQRHFLMRDMTRAAMRALGLELLAPDECASSTVTAVKGPEGLDVEEMRKVIKERFRVQLAGGQGSLKGKIFRIGHMGYAGPKDVLTTVASLECALSVLGYDFQLGSGVRAAQEVWLEEVRG
ncbi:MAG: alanine--glyoxylate aminotransferase family protein [Firmicutes bacterium]|nr:alanine--glyoxylate aminotransferase family protein [Bacillota bacterium]